MNICSTHSFLHNVSSACKIYLIFSFSTPNNEWTFSKTLFGIPSSVNVSRINHWRYSFTCFSIRNCFLKTVKLLPFSIKLFENLQKGKSDEKQIKTYHATLNLKLGLLYLRNRYVENLSIKQNISIRSKFWTIESTFLQCSNTGFPRFR